MFLKVPSVILFLTLLASHGSGSSIADASATSSSTQQGILRPPPAIVATHSTKAAIVKVQPPPTPVGDKPVPPPKAEAPPAKLTSTTEAQALPAIWTDATEMYPTDAPEIPGVPSI